MEVGVLCSNQKGFYMPTEHSQEALARNKMTKNY